jgi:peptidoglycan/LPS O-acetylase OafA/YrhL
MNTNDNRNLRLDSIRGLSALMIFIFHINGYINPNQTIVQKGFDYFASLLFLGLQLFFVLSGFSLMKFTREFALRQTWWTYAKRRLNRVIPAYFGTTMLWFSLPFLKHIVLVLLPFFDSGSNLGQAYSTKSFTILLINLLLLQWYIPMKGVILSGVTWSLVAEIQFYLLFPLLVRKVSQFSTSAIVMLFLSIQTVCLTVAATDNPLSPILRVSVLQYILLFYGGMYLASKNKDVEQSGPRYPFLCLAVLWALWTTFTKNSAHPVEVVSRELFSSALAMLLFVQLLTLPVPNWVIYMLSKFGKVSFSFYLVHQNISDRVTQIVFRFVDSPLRIYVALISSFVLSLLVAIIMYTLFENWQKPVGFVVRTAQRIKMKFG